MNRQVDSGATAVYLACQEGHVDVVRHLVDEAGASLRLRCYDGMSCLHAATQSGQQTLLQWLVRALYSFNAKITMQLRDMTFLHLIQFWLGHLLWKAYIACT